MSVESNTSRGSSPNSSPAFLLLSWNSPIAKKTSASPGETRSQKTHLPFSPSPRNCRSELSANLQATSRLQHAPCISSPGRAAIELTEMRCTARDGKTNNASRRNRFTFCRRGSGHCHETQPTLVVCQENANRVLLTSMLRRHQRTRDNPMRNILLRLLYSSSVSPKPMKYCASIETSTLPPRIFVSG